MTGTSVIKELTRYEILEILFVTTSLLFDIKYIKRVTLKHISNVTTVKTLSANPIKQPTNYLSVFDHFVGLAFKGLTKHSEDIKILTPRGVFKTLYNISDGAKIVNG